jgi:anhydro-N-acetylmuramic acid kinase
MLQKKMKVIGLMSGTSADGITAALTLISEKSLQVLRFKTFPFKKEMREKILGASRLNLKDISRLNAELGILFSKAAREISKGHKADIVGSHGQTLWHGPGDNPPNTFQIGEPAFIAEEMNCPVVADFRPQDIASGGQGAPLIAAFDQFLYGQGTLRAVLNIGGIANLSFVGKNKLWSSFDTGPGNCLMDLAVRILSSGKKSLDRNGILSAKGKSNPEKIKEWLKISYFKKSPPKSLDKNEFGEKFLNEHFGKLKPENLPDILATLADLTAQSIAQAIEDFAPQKVSEVIVSGGGALNPFLMRRLSAALKPIPLVSAQERGMPVMAKEATCFAWMAYRAFNRLPNNCPAATGARGSRILGKIIYPPK